MKLSCYSRITTPSVYSVCSVVINIFDVFRNQLLDHFIFIGIPEAVKYTSSATWATFWFSSPA